MADTTFKYYVSDSNSGWNFFEDLTEAQERARKEAWRDAEDVYVYKVIAVANAPEEINTVQVKTI